MNSARDFCRVIGSGGGWKERERVEIAEDRVDSWTPE